jgi:hypothetical protein
MSFNVFRYERMEDGLSSTGNPVEPDKSRASGFPISIFGRIGKPLASMIFMKLASIVVVW